jgi:CDP-diacylglycerol--serine O-phosphatidyltransferase
LNLLQHLPNLLTVLNLVCGCLGIINLWSGNPEHTAYFVWVAGIFDFFDGFAARLLKVMSPIGKDLDSLADMVSFGLLPSLFMYRMMEAAGASPALCYVALFVAVCSALRLAVFNNDATQTDSFRGVPTPANTFFLTGLPFLKPIGPGLMENPTVLAAIAVIFSLLLVSRFELFALKFKSFGWADNKLRYSFLLLALILLAILQLTALPLIIILYIGLSLGSKVFSR